jgi:hypothetical protein
LILEAGQVAKLVENDFRLPPSPNDRAAGRGKA